MPKILAIDDKQDNLTAISALLKNLIPDSVTITAQSGPEGIEKTKKELPDTILLDIKMPRMDGFEVCKRLKSDKSTRHIPIIMLTAVETDPKSRIKGLELGADAFLTKPIDEAELAAQVNAMLRIKKAEDLLRQDKDLLEDMVQERTKALRESEERYHLIFDGSRDAIFITGTDAGFIEVSEAACSLTGYSKEELKKMSFPDLHEPEALQPYNEYFERVKAGEAITTEARILRKDGTKVDAELSNKRIRIRDAFYIHTVARDITNRKRAEEALRESEERYGSVIDNIGIGVSLISPNMQVLTMNKQMRRWYPDINVSERPICYKAFHKPRGDKGCANCPIKKTVKDGRVHESIMNTTQGDKIKNYRIISSPIKDKDGKIVASIEMVEDITERMRAEEEKKRIEVHLRQAQKMEAIGTLAGGIAHDFNNILGAIIGYAEMMEMFDVPKESPMRGSLEEVLQAANRAKDLVRQILTFSRQTEQERVPIQVSSVVKEGLKFLRASLPMTVEIRQHIENKTATVLADPTQMHQVLMNLCTNAAHAMRDTGGVLEVSLTETDFDTPAAGQFLDLAPGPYVRLAVSDTGHGMDHSVMERIFDPYFTTKRPGEGTGLGLAVVHGIVKSHGGALTVESEAGKGTTFQVFIPRLKRGPVEHETGTTAPVPEGNERILFVDDEKALVDSGSKILEHLGYEVVARTSSIEALETFRTRPEIFDLVISDQTMPHMTGVELARELMHIRPDIPVILCTGFSERVTPEKAKAEGIREFIMKPLSLRNFAETVRKVLDGQRETSNQQPATSNQNGKRVDH